MQFYVIVFLLYLSMMFRYKGYCPQLKYNFGKTFGQQTSELSKVHSCFY